MIGESWQVAMFGRTLCEHWVPRERALQLALALVILGWSPPSLSQTEGATPPSQSASPPLAGRSEPVQGATAPKNSVGSDASAKGPVIVPPKLQYFHSADYPELALEQGLEATVRLKLLVAADGTVGDVTVAAPAGNGFDEAATAAAQRFIFSPAKRDGVSVPVYILYDYRFTAPVVEAQIETAPPTLGNIVGRLLVSGVEEPLAGARVSVIDAAGQKRETVTDVDGRWVVIDLDPGTYMVQVSSEGFEAVELQEDVVAGEETQVTYRVGTATEGVEVIVTGERPPREVTRRTLERREISRVPGTGGDALRSLQSLPSVARPPGLAGLLIVRGAAPQDTNVFVDGSLVPQVYHFGGLSSVVPTELLDKIDFYPGNFSAQYGRVLGGVVDVKMRSPATDCLDENWKKTGETDCFHGFAQADLIDTRAMISGPLGEDWTFAIAGRRSWLDAWIKPVLEEANAGTTTAPVYFDYQGILETNPTKASRLRLQLYGADDALELLITTPSAQNPGFGGNLQFATAFYRLQAIYEHQLSDDWNLFSTLSVGRDRIQFGIGQLRFDLDSYPISFRTELGWKIASGIKVNAGLDFLVTPVDILVRAPLPPRPGEPPPGPFVASRVFETTQKTTVFRPGWYVEGEVQATRRLNMVPGLRVDFARDSGHADFSPRFAARYLLRGLDEDAGEDGVRPLKTSIKGGVGVFAQPPQFQETNAVFGTPNIQSNRSIHYSLGVEQELTDQVELSVDAYFKDLVELVSRQPTLTGFEYNNEGSGRIMGIETLLRYKPDERFFGWLAYTLSRSTRRNAPDEDEFKFQFDQTHILTALGSYKLGDGWEFGMRFRIVSGNNTTPVVQAPSLPAVYSADSGSYIPIQGEPFGERLPLFHQLDIRIEKRWQWEHAKLTWYLDVWNAYNNAAQEAIDYNFDFSRRAFQSGLPIIPSLGLRGEF